MKRSLLICLACLIPLAHAAEPLAPEQFEWRQDINIEASGEAIYRFDLPTTVHAGSRRQDLGDLRIFNSVGEVVPHALIDDAAPAQMELAQAAVAFFPIHLDGKANADAVSVAVRRTADGTLVATHIKPGASVRTQLVGYVIDTSAINNSRRALLLDWQPQLHGTILPVVVDGSNDLQTWHPISPGTQLVDLRSNDQHLQHKRIDLAGSAEKYFRIRWPKDQDGIILTSANLETASTAPPPDRTRWTLASSVHAGSAPGEFLFDSAALPVSALRLELPEINTVVPLQIHHRNNEHESWREATNTVAFRIMRNNKEIRSPEIALCCGNDRYWRITFDQRGGGIGSGQPRIALGWTPRQGIFIARGTGPFLLAYGNAAIPPAAFAAATLVPGYRPEQYQAFSEARFADPVARATPAAPEVAKAGLNWRTIGLWSVLIGGVLLLALMVWRLLRQLGQAPGSAP